MGHEWPRKYEDTNNNDVICTYNDNLYENYLQVIPL